jgi:nucleoside-diphosphate-sugar epimerase
VRILVTGGTSLLMRETAAALAARGDDVAVLQRNTSSLPVRQVRGDVRDAALVARAVAGCDAVIHGAAKVGVVGQWEEYRSVNVDGTANVLAAARRHGVRLVHVSTPSVAHSGRSLVGAATSAEPSMP